MTRWAVHYQLFEDSKIVPSKASFDPADVYTGRLNPRHLAPPRTIATLKRHIADLEAVDPYLVSEVFLSANDLIPIDDNSRIVGRRGETIGSSSINPLAVVVASLSQLADLQAARDRIPTSYLPRTPHVHVHTHFKKPVPKPERTTDGEEPIMSTTELNRVATNQRPKRWLLAETKHPSKFFSI